MNLLREGEHQHAVRKKRAVHYHPGIGGPGESENISSNNRWAIQKRFQDGTYHIHTSVWLWKDEDGNLVIIESEAEKL